MKGIVMKRNMNGTKGTSCQIQTDGKLANKDLDVSYPAVSFQAKLEGDKTLNFRKQFYNNVSNEEWNNWKWQIANRIETYDAISRFLTLRDDEKKAIEVNSTHCPFAITPYYLSLLDLDDQNSALRKTVVPRVDELIKSKGESEDPLSEEETSPVEGIVHRYPDRVLFLTTGFCSVYCRYCTRSHMVDGHSQCMKQHWEKGIQYIRDHEEVRDVIISGGDPLTLSDDEIAYLLNSITSIEHVEIVRLGTKVPMVLPQRITENLLNIFRRYKPLYLSIHCTHPDEITPESMKAINAIADAGVVMGSQTVLLKGINDDPVIMGSLMHKLLKNRIKPYYLFQCDPIVGSKHFRTTVAKGQEIIHSLRGFTSGYAVPQYVIDAPGGGGKVPILPNYYKGRDKDNLYIYNYEGKVFAYPDEEEEF
jgi:lysine 2,3-aminomutase